ncbi:MAG: septum formation initiator family protein, partial [Bacilli bacterium]|nr:septum formation initiator family protein [Bacilli bacterium]
MTAKKKIPKASKHRLMIFGTLSIILMGYFFVTLITYTININQLKEKESALTTELGLLKSKADDLSNTIQRLKDPDYVARYARENYYYSANGEYILKIEDKKTEAVEIPKAQNQYKYYIYGSALCIALIFIYIIKKK